MLRLLDGAPQLKDATAARSGVRVRECCEDQFLRKGAFPR